MHTDDADRTGPDNGPAFARAKKSLGQNFLTDSNIARKIVSSLGIEPGDKVLEIGPGRGALTGFLAQSGALRVAAVEKDAALAGHLRQTLPGVEVAEGDALAYPWEDLDGWKVVGNLPYNIASRLLWDLACRGAGIRLGVFMVQHEVALRLTAQPGGKTYGALSAWMANFCRLHYLFKVPPSAFLPRPKVDSAVIGLAPLAAGDRARDPKALSGVLARCFQHRRKQLGTILKAYPAPAVEGWFLQTGIPPQARPETVSPEDFRSMSECLGNSFSA